MTIPRHVRRALLLVALATGALAVASCTRAPSPQGWAAPRPIKVNGGAVLVDHKATLYLLAGTTASDLSSTAMWQFPPKDKATFPISIESQDNLNASIDSLGSIDDATKTNLKKMVGQLMVSGPSKATLDTAIKNTSAPADQRTKLTSLVDATVSSENNALNNLQAFYGDIGISADAKTAFLSTFRGFVFALDTSNGHVRWLRDAGAEMVGGIAVDGNTLYFGTKGNRVFAVNATTGNRIWEFATGGEVWATPTVDGDTIYVTSLDGSLYALDKSGNKKWVFSGAGSGIASRPVVSSNAVFVGAFDNRLYSVKKSNGSENWSIKAGNWFWATPLLYNGVLYAPSLDGKVYAVDATTGKPAWSQPFDTGSQVRSAPVIAGGGVIVAATNGKVFKLDPKSGHLDQGGSVMAGTKILADLTTDGDATVYVTPTSATLYVISASAQLTAHAVTLP